MNFLQKKLWIAWSKFRFLRMPVERRARLEVTTDGRHLTFLLTALGEAGYGVYVVGSPFVFRELMLLRKSVPMPFVIGGKERECGISISDKSGFNHGEHNRAPGHVQDGATKGWPEGRWSGSDRVKEHRGGKRFFLDYDYFSGLTTKKHESEVDELTTIERQGGREKEQPQVGPKGEGVGTTESKSTENTEVGEDLDKNESRENFNHELHEYSRIEAEQTGLRLASQASASEPDSLTSKLAHAPVSESLIRSADGRTSSPATSYSPPATALRAPYFMHPSVYHRGLHKSQLAERSKHVPCSATALDARRSTLDSAAKRRRRFRLGFFGTHDREFYTKHYHFPGMNRFEILEVFLQKFGDRITPLRGFPRDWDSREIAVSIDSRGGDRRGKSFLSQDHYFEALQECDFVLSPPGWCMPLSHNLVEAMFCGAIPITNAGAFMAEPLTDGVNCLEFADAVGLVSVIQRALAMDSGDVSRMRNTVRDCYERILEPQALAERLRQSDCGKILVNAEENSVPLFCKEFQWTPDLK